MAKPVILTGIRANYDLHIGNYLGALLPMVDMAKQRAGEYQINMFMPDLHSFTTPIDHDELQQGIENNLRLFVAAGLPLDNPDIHIYRQSFVPAHSELTWILDCFTGIGEMNRMTQLKDKLKLSTEELKEIDELHEVMSKKLANDIGKKPLSFYKLIGDTNNVVQPFNKEASPLYRMISAHYREKKEDRVSIGLFNYPVLMAADILLYGASYVPVGDDQTQHLEFTRDIAERMNSRFDELFVVPKPVKEQHKFFNKDQGLRIRDLLDPTKKMSKSDETGKGVIFLSDTPEAARKKIMGAATDSFGDVQYDYQERPGISNLLDLYKLFGGNSEESIGQTQYGPLKSAVADKVAEFLQDFQSRLASVDQSAIDTKLKASEELMNKQANQTLLKTQKAVGLRS